MTWKKEIKRIERVFDNVKLDDKTEYFFVKMTCNEIQKE